MRRVGGGVFDRAANETDRGSLPNGFGNILRASPHHHNIIEIGALAGRRQQHRKRPRLRSPDFPAAAARAPAFCSVSAQSNIGGRGWLFRFRLSH
jgi:hypothetical protein